MLIVFSMNQQADPTNLRHHCPLLPLPVVHSFNKPRRVFKVNERDCHSLLTGLHYNDHVLVLARPAPCRTLQRNGVILGQQDKISFSLSHTNRVGSFSVNPARPASNLLARSDEDTSEAEGGEGVVFPPCVRSERKFPRRLDDCLKRHNC